MGNVIATDRGRDPCRDDGRPAFSAARLRASPAVLGLPRSDRAHNRHRANEDTTFEKSNAIAVLEPLLAPIAGESAATYATALVEEFGSLNDLAAASIDQITDVLSRPDIAAFLDDMRVAMHTILRERVAKRPVISTSKEVADYIRSTIGFAAVEQVHVMFLDTRNGLIRAAKIGSGGVNTVVFEPRQIMRRALDLGATGLIVAHNHPSGCPEPSANDIALTRRLAACAQLFEIVLHDHIIVGRAGFASMRRLGLI